MRGIEKRRTCWSTLGFWVPSSEGGCSMSTSLLYHAFGVRGYRHVKTEYLEGEVILPIEQPRPPRGLPGRRLGRGTQARPRAPPPPHPAPRPQAGVPGAGRAAGGVPALR